MALDLNNLRERIIANQNRNDTYPNNPASQVVVDRDGNVKMGTDIAPGEITTQVPQETFA